MEVRRKMLLKSLITKVLKGLPFLAPNGAYPRRAYPISDIDDENEAAATTVPEDVKEGHFAVIAIKGEETKRFIVELDYLTDPDFMRLLKQAKEEYGFEQKGVLVVPCRPQELQKIIENRRVYSGYKSPVPINSVSVSPINKKLRMCISINEL